MSKFEKLTSCRNMLMRHRLYVVRLISCRNTKGTDGPSSLQIWRSSDLNQRTGRTHEPRQSARPGQGREASATSWGV